MIYLITGGTGFIGQKLTDFLLKKNAEKIFILTRKNKISENQKIIFIQDLSQIKNVDCIINLAGEPIAGKLWSKKQKEILISSRLQTTKKIVELINNLENKPKLISASAIGFYGSQDSSKLDENSLPIKNFSHNLCKIWEDEATKVKDVAIIRLGVVLGKNGGMLKKLLPLFKMNLGSQIGDGTQYLSWVHIEDVVSAINFIAEKNLNGTFNLTAPNATTNCEFTKILAKSLNKKTFFPLPKFMVKILYGQMGQELLLEGQNVYPKNLLQNGFKFKFESLQEALLQVTKQG